MSEEHFSSDVFWDYYYAYEIVDMSRKKGPQGLTYTGVALSSDISTFSAEVCFEITGTDLKKYNYNLDNRFDYTIMNSPIGALRVAANLARPEGAALRAEKCRMMCEIFGIPYDTSNPESCRKLTLKRLDSTKEIDTDHLITCLSKTYTKSSHQACLGRGREMIVDTFARLPRKVASMAVGSMHEIIDRFPDEDIDTATASLVALAKIGDPQTVAKILDWMLQPRKWLLSYPMNICLQQILSDAKLVPIPEFGVSSHDYWSKIVTEKQSAFASAHAWCEHGASSVFWERRIRAVAEHSHAATLPVDDEVEPVRVFAQKIGAKRRRRRASAILGAVAAVAAALMMADSVGVIGRQSAGGEVPAFYTIVPTIVPNVGPGQPHAILDQNRLSKISRGSAWTNGEVEILLNLTQSGSVLVLKSGRVHVVEQSEWPSDLPRVYYADFHRKTRDRLKTTDILFDGPFKGYVATGVGTHFLGIYDDPKLVGVKVYEGTVLVYSDRCPTGRFIVAPQTWQVAKATMVEEPCGAILSDISDQSTSDSTNTSDTDTTASDTTSDTTGDMSAPAFAEKWLDEAADATNPKFKEALLRQVIQIGRQSTCVESRACQTSVEVAYSRLYVLLRASRSAQRELYDLYIRDFPDGTVLSAPKR